MPRMAPAVSALARQTMTAAFEDLERTISPTDAREMRAVTTFQLVRDAALDVETQLAARQALRNMRRMMPLFNGLEHYAKVVDVLCNGTPFLSWIWSPVSLILRVASEYVEAFEQIMKAYSRLAAAMSRFGLLSNTFSDPDFQHSLAVYYANILEFHKHAYKFVRRSGWRLLFLTSWGRFQRRFDNIIEDLERHGDLIDRAANARHISEAGQLRQDILACREDGLEKVKKAEEQQAIKQYHSILSWLRIDESEQLSIFESALEEGSKFPGTCSWMLKNDHICPWLQKKPGDRLLWLQGNPGSGKSVLSTQLVNFLRTRKDSVISHYCSQTFASSTKYEAVLKSLLHQLLRNSGELLAYAYQDFVVGKRLPTVSNIEQLIQTLLGALSEAGQTEFVWIVVDGIEDCEISRQARLITLLSQLTKPDMHGNTVCKVLITCRTQPTKLKRVWQKHSVSLSDETEQLTKAIKLYASQRLRLLHERLQQLELGSEDVDAIEEAIAQKAAGMFLYARLILDYLGTNIFFSGDELKQSIGHLPATISEFYRNILAQMLSRFDARSADRIRCALSWIAYAKRPLKRQELLSALAFSSGDPEIKAPAPKYMLELCSPLVEERRDTTLSFIHVSVKEFLQSSSTTVAINEHDALREQGIATVTCLLSAANVFDRHYQEQGKLLRLVKGVHALHVYSTEFWTEYLLANAAYGLETSTTLVDLASRLATTLGILSNECLDSPAKFSGVMDDRLCFLDHLPDVQEQVNRSLMSRSLQRLEAHVLDQTSATDIRPLDGVSLILNKYQRSVETVLDQDSCPGASTEELELFKTHFRTSAYTCRLRSCPRATIGFNTAILRREHEIGHAGGFRCSFSGCHYPPCRTAQSLEMHDQKYHSLNPARKSIRRVEKLLPGLLRDSCIDTANIASGRRVSPRQGKVALPVTDSPIARSESTDLRSEIGFTVPKMDAAQNAQLLKRGNEASASRRTQTHTQPLVSSTEQQGLENQTQRLMFAQTLLEKNPEITKFIDNREFPMNALDAGLRESVPHGIKTWAQLKRWAQDQSNLSQDSGQKLLSLQTLHYVDLMRRQQTKANSRSPEGLSQATSQPESVRTSPDPPALADISDGSLIECICNKKEEDGNSVSCKDCNTRQHLVCYYGLHNPQVPWKHRCIFCQRKICNALTGLVSRGKSADEWLKGNMDYEADSWYVNLVEHLTLLMDFKIVYGNEYRSMEVPIIQWLNKRTDQRGFGKAMDHICFFLNSSVRRELQVLVERGPVFLEAATNSIQLEQIRSGSFPGPEYASTRCNICLRSTTKSGQLWQECGYAQCRVKRFHTLCQPSSSVVDESFCSTVCMEKKIEANGPGAGHAELDSDQLQPRFTEKAQDQEAAQSPQETLAQDSLAHQAGNLEDASHGGQHNLGELPDLSVPASLTRLWDSTTEDYGDPKVIARILSLPVPDNEDFPTLHELHEILRPDGLGIPAFITALFGQINSSNLKLLAHMTLMIAEVTTVSRSVQQKMELWIRPLSDIRETDINSSLHYLISTGDNHADNVLEKYFSKTINRLMVQLNDSQELSTAQHYIPVEETSRTSTADLSKLLPETSRPIASVFGVSAENSGKDADMTTLPSVDEPSESMTTAESRRIQIRICQRNYRKKLKKRPEDIERRAASGSTSPEPLKHLESQNQSAFPVSGASHHVQHSNPESATQSTSAVDPHGTEASQATPSETSKIGDSHITNVRDSALFPSPQRLASELALQAPENFPSLSNIYYCIPEQGGIAYEKLRSFFFDRFLFTEQHLLKCLAAVATRGQYGRAYRRIPLPSVFEAKEILATEQMPWHTKALLDSPEFLAEVFGLQLPPSSDFPSLREIHSSIPTFGTRLSNLWGLNMQTRIGGRFLLESVKAIGRVETAPSGSFLDYTVLPYEVSQLTNDFLADWAATRRQATTRTLDPESEDGTRSTKRTSTTMLESSSSDQEAKRLRQNKCEDCTSAMMKCDLEYPACRRCKDSGIDCIYPYA